METSETAEIPEPIIPKATKNQGDDLSPSKKLLALLCLDVNREISIKRAKYASIMYRIK
jgi:hypothetical protein